MELNKIPVASIWNEVQRLLNENFQKIKNELNRIGYSRTVYTSWDDVDKDFTDPKDGDIIVYGDTFAIYKYNENSSSWVDTGETLTIDLSLDEYATLTKLNETEAELQTNIDNNTDLITQLEDSIQLEIDNRLANAVQKEDIVNNLTDGGADKALSAEQGRVLKSEIGSVKSKLVQVSSENTTSEDEEIVWGSNDGEEEYAKIGAYGIKAKAFMNMDGTPLSGNTNYISNSFANFGKRRIGCVKYQPIIENAINHIVEYGQSLSVGGSSIAISTIPEEGCYMLGLSVRDTTSTNFSPLRNNDGSDDVEAISTGEDMVVPTINALKYLCKQSRINTEFLGTSSGNGGLIIDHLSKVSQAGKHYYQDNFLSHITNAKSAADIESKKIVCPAIMFIQGESDYSITKEYATGSYIVDYTEEGVRPAIDYYKNKLVQLKNDMQADIMNIYGQSLKPLFFVHAVGSGNQAARGAVVNMAQIEACAENDDMILVGAPTFAPHTDVHLTGNGYRWWAEFFARTIADSIFNNYKFEPVMPFDFKAIGNKIVIAHKVPCPPLVIDTYTVELRTNFGFKLYSSSNNNTITGVEVDGCNVIVTFAKEVVGTYELNYAASGGTGGNNRGNICDSDRCATLSQYIDDSENIYAPSGEINYRPKDKDGNFIFGEDYPMQNWCIPYSYIINF